MEKRIYYSYVHIHKTVKKLAGLISASGYTPDLIVAIGTGGFIPARILKTYLDIPVLTVGLRLYDKNNQPSAMPRKIQWIDEVEKKLSGKRILLVDEIDDSRLTLAFCIGELLRHNPAEIAVSVLHNKKKTKKGDYPPEVQKIFTGDEIGDIWVSYPWDADDIEEHEQLAREQGN